MKNRLYTIACLLIASRFALAAGAPSRDATHKKAADLDRIVVMISVDGLAAYYFDDPKAEMPTIRELAQEGARASMMKASTPTVTWPNHTTLVTGVEPARHGVVGNNYFDRTLRKNVALIADPEFDKDQIVKVPTVYDIAKEKGMTTAAVRWPATRNAKTLDWAIPDVRLVELQKKYTTPSLQTECEAAGIKLAQTTSEEEHAPHEGKDDVCVRAFNFILSKHRPNLALLHLEKVDHTEHLHGPKSPEAYEAVKEADAQVRAVWDELKRDFPGKATLIIVSDHGFSPIEKELRPNVLLRQAGLVEEGGKKKKSKIESPVHIVVQGGAAFVYVLDEKNRPELIEKMTKLFGKMDGIDTIAGPGHLKDFGVAEPKDDPHAPDMILFAKEGCTFGDTAAGDLPFIEKPERRGSHGHNAALPDLHATFVAWGAGIRPGAKLEEISNTTVAPTIAKLLHLSMPNTDGKPLTAALAE